jgi:FtsP/CotA-like multicopper oxidase with cupredoxin domain
MAGAVAIGAGLYRPGSFIELGALSAAQDDNNWLPKIQELESVNGLLNLRLRAAIDTTRGGTAIGYAWSQNPTGDLTMPDTPGPTLRLRRGDRLRIRLENELPEATNLHVHGLHVSPSRNSDNIFVHVPELHEGGGGGEHHSYFDFEYLIPDDHRSGLFWYHPHLHRTTASQVRRGLAGVIIIEESEVDAQTIRDLVKDVPERLIVLQQLIPGGAPAKFHLNGKENPTLQFRPGERERWRILNATSETFLNLYLDGHPFHRVAVDGNWLETAEEATVLPLGPAERAEILIDWREDADSYVLSALAPGSRPVFEKLATTTVQQLAELVPADVTELFGGTPAAGLGPPGDLLPLDDLRNIPDVPTRLLDFQSLESGNVIIDGKEFKAGRVDQTVELGGLEEWTVKNTSDAFHGWHPLHIHVNDFQVLSITANGDPSPLQPVWYTDTVPLPTNGEVKIRVIFPDFAGRFVYHCHFLHHEDEGMMGVIDVAEPVRIDGSTVVPATARVTAGPALGHVVNSGVSVVWTNREHDECRIVAVDKDAFTGEPLFASGTLTKGESFLHIFDAPGVYRYRCVSAHNPSLDGSVRVAAEQTIDIVDGAYQPELVTVAVGTTVTWTNRDSVPHTATADALDASGAPLFDTGQFGQRVTRSHTFAEPGNYGYHSAVDPEMYGEIRVRPVTRQSVSLALGDDVIELPEEITVFKDSTVTWANRGETSLNVFFDENNNSGPLDAERPFGSGQALYPGQRFSHTFETAGRFKYNTFATEAEMGPDLFVKVVQPIEITAYGEFAFEPQDVTEISPNAEVVWINRDATDHAIVVHPAGDDDGEPLFDSGPIAPGQRRGFAFNTLGIFVFRTKAHPDLVGTITLE